jgi:hypothetical protein
LDAVEASAGRLEAKSPFFDGLRKDQLSSITEPIRTALPALSGGAVLYVGNGDLSEIGKCPIIYLKIYLGTPLENNFTGVCT